MTRILVPAVVVAIGIFAIIGMEAVLDELLARVLLFVAFIASLMALGIVRRKDKRISPICDPLVLFMGFLAQFYVIGPVALHIWGLPRLYFFRGFMPEQVLYALGGCALMVLAVLAGYHMPVVGAVADRLPEFRSSRKLPGRWVETAFVAAGLGGGIGWLVFQGGFMAILGMGYGGGRGGGAMFTVTHVLILIGTMLLAWRIANQEVRRFVDWLPLVALLMWQVLFFGILFGVRKYLFYLFFGLLTIWLLRRGKDAVPKTRIAATLALLLVFFSVWGSVRGKPMTALVGAESDTLYAETQPLHLGYVNSVAGPFAIASLVWEVFPDQEPFRHGQTLLVTLLAFIPRAVWPDKPIGIGKELTRYLIGPHYEEFQGFSVAPTVVADFYLNFGWFGVVAGGLLLGALCGVITSYAVHGMRSGRQLRAARVLIPAVFVMMLGEIRGDMSTILLFYVLGYVPLLVALTFFDLDGDTVRNPSVPI